MSDVGPLLTTVDLASLLLTTESRAGAACDNRLCIALLAQHDAAMRALLEQCREVIVQLAFGDDYYGNTMCHYCNDCGAKTDGIDGIAHAHGCIVGETYARLRAAAP